MRQLQTGSGFPLHDFTIILIADVFTRGQLGDGAMVTTDPPGMGGGRHGDITKKTLEYLWQQFPRTPEFYMMTKMQKGQLPGRPSILANVCPTKKISKFVDFFIQPLFVRNQIISGRIQHLSLPDLRHLGGYLKMQFCTQCML